MILVEIRSPDGRMPRIKADNLEEVKANLLPGYEIIGRVYGADGSNNGGFVERRGESGLMTQLLEAYGDEMRAFIAKYLTDVREKAKRESAAAAEVYGAGYDVRRLDEFVASYLLPASPPEQVDTPFSKG